VAVNAGLADLFFLFFLSSFIFFCPGLSKWLTSFFFSYISSFLSSFIFFCPGLSKQQHDIKTTLRRAGSLSLARAVTLSSSPPSSRTLAWCAGSRPTR
jgi:hypothetical protein